uniref:Uncharacterized protein n=1 Tax=Heterorhabditis bacteriophora TaxID=37862 RepID=A0A1I7WG73_HETBA
MRYFDSGHSSSYVIVSPKEKDKIHIIENEKNAKIEIQQVENVKEGKENVKQKSTSIHLSKNPSEKLSKENNKFLKILKSVFLNEDHIYQN